MSDHTMITEISLEKADGQFESLLDPGARAIEGIDGIVGLTSRSVIRPRPGRQGVLNTTKYRDSQPIVINGQLFGDTAADAWAEYNALVAVCATAVSSDRVLKWKGWSVALQMDVRVVSLSAPVLVREDVIKYQMVLRPSESRSFAQTESTYDTDGLSEEAGGLEFPVTFPFSFSPSGGAVADFTVDGTDSTPPIFELYGEMTSPRIKLLSTGEEIILTGVIDADRYWVIDTDLRQIRLDDGTVRNNLFDFSESTWFELPTGPQTIQLFAASWDASAYARITYRSAYA